MSIGDVGLRAKDEKKTNDLFKKKKTKHKMIVQKKSSTQQAQSK